MDVFVALQQYTPWMLTLTQVADRLAVSPETVSAWIRNGELAAINVSAGKVPRYRIEESDLEKFLDERRTKPERRYSPLPAKVTRYC